MANYGPEFNHDLEMARDRLIANEKVIAMLKGLAYLGDFHSDIQRLEDENEGLRRKLNI